MSCISLWAQGTVEDYNRAYALREKYNAKHVLYAGVVPHWVDQTSAFWYVRQTEKGKEYVKRFNDQAMAEETMKSYYKALDSAPMTGSVDECNR